ncbi:MAG: anti-sigma factor domain-containing protein [Acidimicrobiales bacterium]
MDPILSHDQLRELLGAFALDAVDADEAAAVSAHLVSCPRCRQEVAEYQQAAAMLANSGEDAPAGVWDAIVSKIETAPIQTTATAAMLGRQAAKPVTSRRIRPQVARRAGALVAAAAAAAIAVLGVQVAHLDHRLSQVTAASAGQNLSAAARVALLDPSARRIALTGAGPSAPRVAEVVALRSGAGFWFNEGLPALASAKTYQLWAMVDGQAISVGVLGDHPQTVAFSLGSAATTDAFAVTVEPAGGSVSPTRPPVASTTI